MSELQTDYQLEYLYRPGIMDLSELQAFQVEQDALVVAGDGSVPLPPMEGDGWYVRNHHEGVDREKTMATCKQVEALTGEQGYREQVQKYRRVIFLINGYDPDIAESIRVLGYDSRRWSSDHSRREISRSRRLTYLEDYADRSSGRYLLKLDEETAGHMAYIYLPAMALRLCCRLDQVTITGAQNTVEERAAEYISGKPTVLEFDSQYEVLAQRDHVVAIHEQGPYAVLGAMRKGYENIISFRSAGEGQPNHVALHSRLGLLTPDIYAELNDSEEGRVTGDNWGGGNDTGGSPRVGGTRKPADELADMLDVRIEQKLALRRAA